MRMQDSKRRIRLPIGPLELVACVTAIDPILWLISAPFGAWVKMIRGELRSHIAFVDSTVTTAEMKAQA
jgi:hypothetical protein